MSQMSQEATDTEAETLSLGHAASHTELSQPPTSLKTPLQAGVHGYFSRIGLARVANFVTYLAVMSSMSGGALLVPVGTLFAGTDIVMHCLAETALQSQMACGGNIRFRHE